MELLTKKHPEMRSVVADYQQMTLLERFRKRAEAREKERRDAWAALEYAKDEGREEARSELGKVSEEKDQVITEKDRENEELRRKLREAGID
jgi:ribosomal protein L15